MSIAHGSVAVLYGSPKTPNPPRGRGRRERLDWACEYCGRLNPVGVYSCIGCGAGKVRVDEVEVEPSRVTLDLGAVATQGVVSDVADFTRELMEELAGVTHPAFDAPPEHVNCRCEDTGGFIVPPAYLKPKPSPTSRGGRLWRWLTTYKGVWY